MGLLSHHQSKLKRHPKGWRDRYTGWMLANLQIFKYVAYPVARIEQERQGKPHMFLGIRGINVKRVYLK